MLIEEMVKLTENDPDMKSLAMGLKKVNDEHIATVADLELAASRKDESKIAYNLACLDLQKSVKDVRMFVLANAPKGAAYLKQLKKPSTKKPAKKPEEKVEEVKPVETTHEVKKEQVAA